MTRELSIGNVDTFLASISSLVGCRPHDDIVIAFMHERSLIVTARIEHGDDTNIEDELDHVCAAAAVAGATSAVAVHVCDCDPQALTGRDISAGLALTAVFQLNNAGTHWRDLREGLPGQPWTPVSEHARDIVREALGNGPDLTREQIAEQLAPRDVPTTSDVALAVAVTDAPEAGVKVADELLFWSSFPDPRTCSVEKASTHLAALITGPAVRDELIIDLVEAGPQRRETLTETWLTWAQHSPAGAHGVLYSLAALARWLRGDGLRANILITYALQADPELTLAGLLRDTFASGVRPHEWEQLARGQEVGARP